MLKRIILFVAVLILAATLSWVVFGSDVIPVNGGSNGGTEDAFPYEPGGNLRWTNVNSVISSLDFDNGKADIYFEVRGKSGTTFNLGAVKLKKISGGTETDIIAWYGLNGTSSTFTFSNNTVSVTHGTYKAMLVIYAIRNGVWEKIEAEVTSTY
ncbi:MAG: hypothetical protein IKI03_00415 [Clostridia bacterium]|nr:hypothetical protein [Clostridia bacterium]